MEVSGLRGGFAGGGGVLESWSLGRRLATWLLTLDSLTLDYIG